MIKSSYITQYIDLLHTILLCLEVEFTVEWQHQSSLLNNYYIILLSVGYEGGHASLIFEVISDFFFRISFKTCHIFLYFLLGNTH